jgi:hypothetical protein
VVEAPLAGQQPHDLADEERVTVGPLVHRRHQLRGRLRAGDQGDEGGHLLLVQAAEQQPAVVLAAGQIG